jgi:1,4-dihydroxy-2-naphthoate octaprenyltransferase
MGNLVGWFYSAPPLRLAYRGLGEFSTAATVGFLVPAMGY